MSRGGRRPAWGTVFALLVTLCVLLAAAALLYGGPLAHKLPQLPSVPEEEGFVFHMIDVGQGLSMLVTCDGQSALIDAGLESSADSIIDFARSRGVRRLEHLFITHPHRDHCGGASRVSRALRPRQLLYPRYFLEEAALATAGEWAGDSGAALITACAGDVYTLGTATVTVLHPSADNEIEDMNLLSLVLLIEYQGKRLLITGDLTQEGEEQLLDTLPPVDVLQVGHHGSSGSTGTEFLQMLTPETALISCGRNNDYGHPHADVLERLDQLGIHILRTDRDGTVTLRIADDRILIETENVQ